MSLKNPWKMEGTQQQQPQQQQIITTEQQQHDPVKEVEVTAKQIVDRLTSNRGSVVDKSEKVKGPVKRISLSSSYGGDQNSEAEKVNGISGGGSTTTQAEGDNNRASVSSNINQSPGRSERLSSILGNIEPTEHEKKAEILLTAVTVSGFDTRG